MATRNSPTHLRTSPAAATSDSRSRHGLTTTCTTIRVHHQQVRLASALHQAGHLLALNDLGYRIDRSHCRLSRPCDCCWWKGVVSDPDHRTFIAAVGVVAEIFHDGITADPVLHLATTRMKIAMIEPPGEAWTVNGITEVVAYVDSGWSEIWAIADDLAAVRCAPSFTSASGVAD